MNSNRPSKNQVDALDSYYTRYNTSINSFTTVTDENECDRSFIENMRAFIEAVRIINKRENRMIRIVNSRLDLVEEECQKLEKRKMEEKYKKVVELDNLLKMIKERTNWATRACTISDNLLGHFWDTLLDKDLWESRVRLVSGDTEPTIEVR